MVHFYQQANLFLYTYFECSLQWIYICVSVCDITQHFLNWAWGVNYVASLASHLWELFLFTILAFTRDNNYF